MNIYSAIFSAKMKRSSLAVFTALALSACSTISSVTDAINPFNGGNSDQGEAVIDPDRISILSLNDNLEVSGTMLTSEIVLPAAYTNPDWPQSGGYANHAVQRTDAPGDLSRLWSKDIGKGSNKKGRIVASPVVAGGRIFAVDGANRVIAMDAESGKTIWTYKVRVSNKGKSRRGRRGIIEIVSNPLAVRDTGGKDKEAVGGGIAVADGRVYVTSGFGVVLALNAVTGEEIWRHRTYTPMHSAPTVDNGRLFAISDDNELFGMNADTGEVLWTYQGIVETARMLTSPSPAVLDDVVVSPFSSGEIVALRVENGGVLWQDALSASGNLTPLATLNDIASGPVLADGYVFAATQSGTFAAFDLRTGQRVWTQPAGTLSYPLVLGDFVYTVTTEGEVACMSKIDGTVIWISQLQAFKNEKKRKNRISWAGPIIAGERLVIMGSNGQGVEVDPFNGAVLRTFKLGGDVYVAPIIANNTVYYVTDGAKLIALR